MNTIKFHIKEYQMSLCAECSLAKIDQISIDKLSKKAHVTRKYISMWLYIRKNIFDNIDVTSLLNSWRLRKG